MYSSNAETLKTRIEIKKSIKKLTTQDREKQIETKIREKKVLQISRRSSVATNSGAETRDDSNHNKNQCRYQETHSDSLFSDSDQRKMIS